MLTPEAGTITGTIAIVSLNRTHGSINSEAGAAFPFQMGSVVAYDTAAIAVGRAVTFNVTGGKSPSAVNITVRRTGVQADTRGNREKSAYLRYLGFVQSGGTRQFQFEYRAPGQERSTFSVTAELRLFTKHRLPIQDGPVMCLKWLIGELEAGRVSHDSNHALTDAEVSAHLASLPVPVKRGGFRQHH